MEVGDASMGSGAAGRDDLEDHHGGVCRFRAEAPDVGIGPMVGMPARLPRLALLAAAVAVVWGTPVLAQETAVVRVKLIQGEVPVDPLAPIWNTIPATEFPMSPQVHWPKRILQVTVKSIKVRGAHNTKQIAFLLEYADPTQDPADGAALEFMDGDKKTHFAHGQPMAQVQGR